MAGPTKLPPESKVISCGQWRGDALHLAVRVQTRASALAIGQVTGGRLQLRVTAPPADGRANDQARRLLATLFGVGQSRVVLVAGQRHRNKVFAIDRPGGIPDALLER